MKSIKVALVFAGCAVTIGILTQVATTPMHAKPADSTNTTGQNAGENRRDVLLELFTSEGCSSCPPADQLLEKFDRTQSIAGVDLIVFSEHVDYWNRLGWTDPFSSTQFSQRQQDYVSTLHAEGPYTPQLIIDGRAQVVGSDERAARSAIEKAATRRKADLRIEVFRDEAADSRHDARRDAKELRVRLEAANAPPGASVFVALARDHRQSKVNSGENSGRLLQHVAVVKTLEAVGKIDARGAFVRDTTVRLNEAETTSWRIVGFVQDANSKQVLGATMTRFPAP